MHDRQTKTIVQVCRGADQIEKAPGPSKLTFCWGGGAGSLLGRGKKTRNIVS